MRNFTLALAVVASVLGTSPAFADVPPPNSEGCMMKAAGDACQKDDMSAGSCVTETCTKLDYSMGTPPKTVEYQCLLCNGTPPADDGNEQPAEDGCAVRGNSGMGAASALGASILGVAVLLISRRARKRARTPRP